MIVKSTVFWDVTLACCLLPAGYLLSLRGITLQKTEETPKWKKLNRFRFSFSLNPMSFKSSGGPG
jgi:hypothetical protein